MQIPAHWNLIGCSMTTLLSILLSPSSILLPPLCHLSFITTWKGSAYLLTYLVTLDTVYTELCQEPYVYHE